MPTPHFYEVKDRVRKIFLIPKGLIVKNRSTVPRGGKAYFDKKSSEEASYASTSRTRLKNKTVCVTAVETECQQ